MTAIKPEYSSKTSDYVPTPREQTIIDNSVSRADAASLAPSVQIDDNTISYAHPEQELGQVLLQEALGADRDFTLGLVAQLANAFPKSFGCAQTQINFMLSCVKSIRPRDQLEAMLATQMAAIHTSIMSAARRLENAQSIQQQDSAERTLNKLARTFAFQLEALNRHRQAGALQVSLPVPLSEETGQAEPPSPTTKMSETNKATTNATPSEVVPIKRASGGR